MSNNTDLAVRQREISALVDGINDLERVLALPMLEEFEDYDRLEAMDILNRIERKILANMPAVVQGEREVVE